MRIVLSAIFVLLLAITSFSQKDIIVLVVDHWEPYGKSSIKFLKKWEQNYPSFADRHRDSNGRPLQHTFFQYNYDTLWLTPDPDHINPINSLCFNGYGEIEIHIHHEEHGTQEQNASHLRSCITKLLDDLNGYGICLTAESEPKKRFGHIHGYWALDNSRIENINRKQVRGKCGVNNEISLLANLGCYADFTFPAHSSMQPNLLNKIYYVTDDDKPASYKYNRNINVAKVNSSREGDLLLFQGPNCPPPSTEEKKSFMPGNFDTWVEKKVCVEGQEDWIFIKMHTHGIRQTSFSGEKNGYLGYESIWGDIAETFWSYVEQKYNDGEKYRLHYVNSREAYNIVQAAIDGKTGNPFKYKDYEIKPYVNSKMILNSRFKLLQFSESKININILNASETVEITFKKNLIIKNILESNNNLEWVSSDGNLYIQKNKYYDTTPSKYYSIDYHTDYEVPSNVTNTVKRVKQNVSTKNQFQKYDLQGRRFNQTKLQYKNGISVIENKKSVKVK